MKRLFTTFWNGNRIEQAAWFLAWFALPLSMKGSGVTVGVAFIVVLARFAARPCLPSRDRLFYILLPLLYFSWMIAAAIYEGNGSPARKEIEKQASFLVIPLMFAFSHITRKAFAAASARGFILAVTLVGFVMLAAAAGRFSANGDWNEFTYHRFASPFHTGAVYFSYYLLFALFQLGNRDLTVGSVKLKAGLGVYFVLLLLLCASKLLVALGLPLLAWQYRGWLQKTWQSSRLVVILVAVIALAASIPFIQRVQRVWSADISVLSAVEFGQRQEPDGLTLRLLLWRFGVNILNEHKAWMTGAGPVATQTLLDEKITRFGMYTGSGKEGDTGYLGYNFHNQFAETLVRTGIPGLVLLLAILAIFAWQPSGRMFAPRSFLWITAGFFMTESVLERQAGIVFTCLVLFSYFPEDEPSDDSNRKQDESCNRNG